MGKRILRPGDDRDIRAAKFEIEKKDTYHLVNLYEWAHDWLYENDWEDVGQELHDDKFEHYYFEKRHQSGTREYRMWWRLQKIPVPGNEYFRYVMLVDWQALGFQKVEVVHEGEKVQTWKGDLTFHIEAWLQLDYNNAWKDHWLMRHVDRLYRHRIWKRQADKWRDECWREAYAFSAWLKKYLDMRSPYEQPDMFHPQKGVGPTPEG